jgi:membrane protein
LFGALIAGAAMLYGALRFGEPAAQPRPPDPRSRWRRILGNVWAELDRDHISIMAAGVAFYSFLSIFPGMSAAISLYGLIADPAVIEEQLAAIAWLLPADALRLVSDQLHSLVTAPPAKLGLGLLISLALALWGAMSGVGTLMQALTVAYEEEERRGLLGFYAQAAVLTVGIAGFALVSLFLIAIVPAALDWLPLPPGWDETIALVRWPLLALLVMVALALIYRFAPSRQAANWHWLRAGTIAAAVLWLLGSGGFSLYVSNLASYDKTYGSLGAVVVLLMWLYLGAYIVLLGAELNSEIDKPEP